jgi:hypothetical protein
MAQGAGSEAEDKRARQTTIVFRDSAFESDVGKTNLAAS